ncbi:hypothetical protein KQ940_01640 [Marinobacterium sp. D7]|uniref:helix-turn-helix domain-containing protein n=1 Tax=Marinobacterium ramblicola TaxID=2849041 RepID=UPI001C2CE815|nr:hypothetical protein [Marinobacterium ramblicola]
MSQPQKTNPRAVGAAGGLSETSNRPHHSTIATPRQHRLLQALQNGPLHREDADRVAGASNAPAVVAQLRARGWDIPCEWVGHIDRDGKSGRHGVYHLSDRDRLKLREMLAER